MKRRRLWAVIRKEFYHLIRDYRSLYLAFAMPLILILLFGYALSLDVDHIDAVVVDFDQTKTSRDFIGTLTASSYFRVLAFRTSSEQAAGDLDHGRAALAVIIPPHFTQTLGAGRNAQIQAILDGSDPNFAGIVRGYLTSVAEQYNAQLLLRSLNQNGLEKIQPPVDGRIRIWFNEDLESRNFIIPGIIAIIIMIVGALLTSLVIAREFENGTMETIKSLPLGAMEFYLGKAFPYFCIALIDVFAAMIMGQVLFGVTMKGDFWLMLSATSLYLCVAISLGLLISAATQSQMVANQLAILITYLPSLLLSNFVFPIVNMPVCLQYLTYVVPARYYIDILVGVYLRNTGLHQLWPSLAVLGAFFVALSILNFRLLKKEGL